MTATEQTKQQAPKPCGCGTNTMAPDAIITDRNRYFTGKFMTARDFTNEQDYHRSRHQLHNRLLHGWGIVCGLKVVEHWSPDCRDHWVVVEPGIAIDCYGRELVLKHKIVRKIWDPPTGETPGVADRGPFLLSIYYCDQPIEAVPALYAEGACDPSGQDYNRVRERIEWDERPFTQAEKDAGCWRVPAQPGDKQLSEEELKQRRQLSEEELKQRCQPCGDENDPEGCLSAACLCAGMIPLALITPKAIVDDQGKPVTDDKGKAKYKITKDEIDLEGRHNVRGAALTHIIGYNWRHGQDLPFSELDKLWGRELRVFFDREINDDPNDRSTGITRSTFRVERRRNDEPRFEVVQLFNDKQDDAKNDIGRPYLQDKCIAVFPIPDAYFEGGVQFQDGDVIHITLKCDFIVDCNGRAVDGNHLKGRTPTGNGDEGGLFESWFFISRGPEVNPKKPPLRD